jgi:hypothetical protein
MEWLVAIAAADPEDLTGAVDRLGISFTDLEDDEFDPTGTEGGEGAAAAQPEPSAEPAAPEVVEPLPEDDHGLGRSFDEEVEAEVAELLGEIDPPSGDASQNQDDGGDAADRH